MIEVSDSMVNMNLSFRQILPPTYTISLQQGIQQFFFLRIQYCPNVVCRLQILNTTLNKNFYNSREVEDM
jgi:hypothetical protein